MDTYGREADHPLHLADVLSAHATLRPEVTAISHPGRPSLTYGALWQQVHELSAALRQANLTGSDRIAVALPGGPELAVAILGVAAHATCVPLNPALPVPELERLLDTARVGGVLCIDSPDTPVSSLARRRGSVVTIQPDPTGPAGMFRVEPPARVSAQIAGSGPGEHRQPDDVAVLLQTSGSTGVPKMVPLSHGNICVSAHNISASLRLTHDDLCLNVLPMYHSHGLMTLMATMAAGAGTVCPSRFDATEFYPMLAELEPTWFTAVPPIHRAIVHAAPTSEAARSSRLRFVRSASAPLPKRLYDELEELFQVPVIESYGMTEAASIMTSNPLPPGLRKPGSVGVPIGTAVAIMDAAGAAVPAGERGEIVIRGATVTRGYADDPVATASAFTDGWFRTGDEGFLDQDGYLFLTGRLKEIVNRGGAKVSPVEVDEVLRTHPGLVDVASFGIPHEALGEDLAAAVVVAQGGTPPTEEELRAYAAARLSPHKVPGRIFFVAELPGTDTGKIRRHELSRTLGTAAPLPVVAPETETEAQLAAIWSRALGVDPDGIGVTSNFFDLGGTSLLLETVREAIRREFGREIPLLDLMIHPTIASLCEYLARSLPADAPPLDISRQADSAQRGTARLARQRSRRDSGERRGGD